MPPRSVRPGSEFSSLPASGRRTKGLRRRVFSLEGAIQKWLQTPPLTHPARTSPLTTASPERLGPGENVTRGPGDPGLKGRGGTWWILAAVSASRAIPDELHV